MTMRTTRLAERSIEALRAEPDKDKTQFTVEGYPGLKVVVSHAGTRRWEFRYTRCGKKEVLQWGGFPGVTIQKIKAKYLEAQAALADGRDPAEESRIRRDDLTLAEFVEQHFLPHQRTQIKSAHIQELMLFKHIVRLYGKRRLKDLTRLDVVKLGNLVKEETSPANANRYLSVFGRVLSLAHEWGFVKVNNAKRVAHFKETGRRHVYMTPEEVRRFDAALEAEMNSNGGAIGAACLRVLLWTGLRRNDVASLRHSDLSLEGDAPSIYVRNPKSGKARHVPINTKAAEILRDCSRFRVDGNEYVFPSTSPRGHIRDLRFTLKKVAKLTGLDQKEDFCTHALRHSYASTLLAAGNSLKLLQEALGHSSIQMTMIYSHLSSDALRRANQTAVEHVMGAK